MGVFVEIKEAERPDLGVDRVAEVIEATGAADRTIVIGFDHVVLKRAAERHPSIRTQAITPARHADIVGVLRAGGANSVSIELEMFHPDDAKALHDAGFSNRVSLPRPEVLATFCPGGRDIITSIEQWIAEGSSTRYPVMTFRSWPGSPSGRLRGSSLGSVDLRLPSCL